MKEVINKNWDYILYEDNGEYIISVLCGSIGIFEINIQLNSEEKEWFLKRGAEYTDELAKQIQFSPQLYNNRKIPR